MTSKIDIVKAYFDAWNAHDIEAILNTFTEKGTYSDPIGGKNLSGQLYADYIQSLFVAFPDLKLELISNIVATNGMVAAPWLLFGTHQGPVGDFKPTGNLITLPGCDFVSVENGKIQTVRGYFDPDCLFNQLT
jgi:steroid delta-isomerase-like uncharacterized protein